VSGIILEAKKVVDMSDMRELEVAEVTPPTQANLME
jgi:hypothetical protein